MNHDAEMAAAALAAPVRVLLHLGFSDPRSPLRLPAPVPPSLRVALTAQLGARGGQLMEAAQGLCCFHRSIAQAMQAAIEALHTGTSLLVDDTAPLLLRAVLVGLEDAGDAARASAISRADQVLRFSRDHTLLLTRDLYEQLDAALTERARLAVPPAWVDAHPELADVFELDWRAAAQRPIEITQMQPARERATTGERLELSHGGIQLSLAAQDCPLTLGRDKSCGLHLGGDAASRVHGRIEFAHDKFYFIDDSRNGTYLLTPQGEEVFLRGERLPLLGRGVISPGAPIVKQTGEVVRYACRSADGIGALLASLAAGPADTKLTH